MDCPVISEQIGLQASMERLQSPARLEKPGAVATIRAESTALVTKKFNAGIQRRMLDRN